jgi:hypothetical protein
MESEHFEVMFIGAVGALIASFGFYWKLYGLIGFGLTLCGGIISFWIGWCQRGFYRLGDEIIIYGLLWFFGAITIGEVIAVFK